jgi:hypothetical protein
MKFVSRLCTTNTGETRWLGGSPPAPAASFLFELLLLLDLGLLLSPFALLGALDRRGEIIVGDGGVTPNPRNFR